MEEFISSVYYVGGDVNGGYSVALSTPDWSYFIKMIDSREPADAECMYTSLIDWRQLFANIRFLITSLSGYDNLD